MDNASCSINNGYLGVIEFQVEKKKTFLKMCVLNRLIFFIMNDLFIYPENMNYFIFFLKTVF